MRIDAQQYYALAASASDIPLKIGALARERIGGLQGISAEAPKPRVTIFGHRWDSACTDLRRFLARNQITFEWVTPDSPDFAKRWPTESPPDANCAALLLVDGKVMTQPNSREIAQRVGLQTRPSVGDYDIVIIGGGPAGLAAAVYGASEGLRTLVVEREAPGGQAGTSSRIENYLGFPNGVSGDELASRALRQARRLGAEILVTRSVSHIDPVARRITMDGPETVDARTILLAAGVNWRRLNIDGFDRLVGKGIYYGSARSEADTAELATWLESARALLGNYFQLEDPARLGPAPRHGPPGRERGWARIPRTSRGCFGTPNDAGRGSGQHWPMPGMIHI
jgi:thioredoxin reductase (NADPH)